MTARIQAFTVVLDQDLRADAAEATVNALSMIKGVASVQPVMVTEEGMIQRARIRHEIYRKLYQAFGGILEEK